MIIGFLIVVTIVLISIGFVNRNAGEKASLVNYPLQEDVQLYLNQYGVSECTITKCPSINELISQYAVAEDELEVNVTDSEVEDYIERIMKSYDKLVDVKGRKIVKKNDFVTVSFSVYYKGKLVSPKKNATLKVGAGKYDEQFEAVLLGMEKGKNYKRKMIVPDDYKDKKMAGKKEIFKIKVINIQKYLTYELNDEFARKNLGAKDAKQYYSYARKKVLEEKKSELGNRFISDILQKIAEECKFHINREEVAEFATQAVELQEQLADVSGMSFEEYMEESAGTKDSFYQKCYEEAEKEVRQALVIGAIAAQMKINLSDEEVKSLSDSNNVDGRYALVKKDVMYAFGLYETRREF